MKGYLFTALIVVLTIGSAIYGFGNGGGSPAIRYAFFALLVFWALAALIFVAVYRSFPGKPQLTSADGMLLDPGIGQVQEQLRQLGFASISRPMLLNMNPATGMVALMDQKNKTFSIAYHPMVAPGKLGTDFVSVVRHRNYPDRFNILTTGNMAEGGTLTVPKGSFMQLFPGDTTSELFRKHIAALQFLQQSGVQAKEITKDAFRPTLFTSLKRMRSTFVSNPLWNTIRALIVTFTKSSGYLGPISNQSAAARQLGR